MGLPDKEYWEDRYKAEHKRDWDRDWKHHQKMQSQSGSGCFVAATRVLTPAGWQNISELNVGDIVFSWSDDEARLVERHVTRCLAYGNRTICKVMTVGSSRPIYVTRYHAFMTQKGWRRTEKLRRGERLMSVSADGSGFWNLIEAVERTNRVEPVFNLRTEREHNFIVEGVVASNFGHLVKLRTNIANLRNLVPLSAVYPTAKWA